MPGSIVLLTDRPDCSHALASALDRVCECITVDTGIVWSRLAGVKAVLADFSLELTDTRRSLRALNASFRLIGRPQMVLLTRRGSEQERKNALDHGASLCTSAAKPADAVVAAVVGLGV